jgi:hypothetical protein
MQEKLKSGAQLASLPDLPPELLDWTLKFLRLPDVFRCLGVSKAWNRAWTHPAIISSLYSQFIPEHASQNDGSLKTFRYLSRSFLRRQLGKPRSTACKVLRYSDEKIFKLDPVLHPGGEYPEITCQDDSQRFGRLWYGHGRLAWQVDVRTFVIDNLQTLKRMVLELRGPALMHGLWVGNCILGKSFIVFDLSKDGKSGGPRYL